MACFLLLAFTLGCGKKDADQNGENAEAISRAQKAGSGLYLTVKNSLPEIQQNGFNSKPNLIAYFCSPIPSKGPIPKESERCIKLNGIIENGKTVSFTISKDDVTAVYNRGNGKVAFEFADNHQLTSNSWHCYSPNDRTDLDSNFNKIQSWQVEVNQRYTFSYGCSINRL